jgi:hypothetical protein
VVVPLGGARGDAPPFGGLYFALPAPNDFLGLQGPVLGAVSAVSAALRQRLASAAGALAGALAGGGGCAPSPNISLPSEQGTGLLARQPSSESELSRATSGGSALAGGAGGAGRPLGTLRAGSGLMGSGGGGSSLCTDAIMKVTPTAAWLIP